MIAVPGLAGSTLPGLGLIQHGFPRVRFATLGCGVERLRRSPEALRRYPRSCAAQRGLRRAAARLRPALTQVAAPGQIADLIRSGERYPRPLGSPIVSDTVVCPRGIRTIRMAKKNRTGTQGVSIARGAVLAGAVILLIGAVTLVETRGWLATPASHEDPRALVRPIRLQVEQAAGFQEFLIALRVYHYRAQPKNEASFVDIFFDTDQGDLFQQGYSYRFRQRISGRGSRYAVRLEREPRFVPQGVGKLEVSTELPKDLGDAIRLGSWGQAFAANDGLEAPERFRVLLQDLGIDPREIRPQLRSTLRRRRFDVTDKGRNWFELDHESWVFSAFAATESRAEVALEDLVLDTRLNRGDPELMRRVQTMRRFATKVHGVRAVGLAPHERATKRIAGD